MDYGSKRWQEKRRKILRRDGWVDQVYLPQGIRIEANTVHHILPAEDYPEYQWADWNLISINTKTHREVHEPYTKALTPLGRSLALKVASEHNIKLQTVTLVIGLPGSGKSTWIKEHIGSGICYELDAIAAAFRLTVPHAEKEHAGARRMAAAMRKAWLAEAPKYARKIFINRAAPDIDEIAETNPDVLVICTEEKTDRPYKYDKALYKQRIADAEEWARLNRVEVIYNSEPQGSPPRV